MHKIVSVVGAVLGALALSTAAYAASPAQTSTPRADHAVVPSGAIAAKGGTVYSNLNTDPSNVFNCCSGWTISTPDSIVGAQQFIATPFTASANGKVSGLELGLAYVTGANSMTVTLAADKKGMPGKTLGTFTVTGVEAAGSCCVLSTGTVKAKIKSGKQYWVIVSASADTWGVWDENTTNDNGAFDYDSGTGWQATNGPRGAFAVMGK